jgi:cellulose synthase (UDP-forming)
MNSILKFFASIKDRYIIWRIHGSSVVACLVNLLFLCLAYLFIPLETSSFNKIRNNFYYYYPQIKKDNPRVFDPLRIIIQTLFLLFIRQSPLDKTNISVFSAAVIRLFNKYAKQPFVRLTEKYTDAIYDKTVKKNVFISRRRRNLTRVLLFASFVTSALAVTQPFDLTYQFIFVILMWLIALLLRAVNNRVSLMLMIFISIIIATRYIYWRLSQTIILITPFTAFCSITLFVAEIYTYIILLLSYFQVSWVLDRKPYPLPKDLKLWPTVDIFIPTYNESLDVVSPCLLACLDLDWPKDKLKIYLLDDGSRSEFEEYCQKIGINYIKRNEHKHAKAGNINNALKITQGELIAIFDCDHIPTRAFLQMTCGWMVHDKNIALVQTPHHFYSEDPFEKNLKLNGRLPAENALFHDFIQKGNDTWNATMFCGSCAVIRRAPLEEIGGIAVETVTEDAHTSLRLNRRGYSSAFISMPLAAGLATESLADHINQRIRWARGMIQIFRIDNPLLGKGLTIPQRLCFTNAMIHFLHGLPRIIFLLAPLPYLFCNVYVIFASGLAILSFVLPYMFYSTLTNQMIQYNKRFYFWGVVYETILSWYITLPTLIALLSPEHGKFNVTAKGASNTSTYFDWTVSKPYILLIVLNMSGFLFGLYNIIFNPYAEISTILINLGWVSYNLLILGAASAVALEAKQVRASPRVNCNMEAMLEAGNGYSIMVNIIDFSKEGLGIALPTLHEKNQLLSEVFHEGSKIHITIRKEDLNYRFAGIVRFSGRNKLGIKVILKDLKSNIEYIRCTFATADRWSHSYDNITPDSLIHGIHTLIVLGLRGYLKMLDNTPHIIREFLWITLKIMIFFFSMLPQPLDVTRPFRKKKSEHNEKQNLTVNGS